MALPYSFSNNTSPTGVQLDTDLAQLGAQSVIPCTVAGTNALVLTPESNTSAVPAYANYMQFSGIAVASNTSSVTARIGSLGILNVYRDSPAGPALLSGNEIIDNCAFTLVYDSALNTGAGGFHLFSTTASFPFSGGTITGSIALTDGASFTSHLTPSSLTAASVVATAASVTSLQIGASAALLTRILSALGTLTYTVTPAASSQAQNMALAGVQTGDAIMLGLPTSIPANTAFTGFVPAAGTVSVQALNAASVTLGAFTLTNIRATAIGNT